MKKAQMEIMGLAVIIILISLGLLFVVRFLVLNEPSQVKRGFTQTQMAANLVNSMLKTSTNCLDTRINDLLEDCAVNKESPGARLVCENGNDSCTFVNNSIDKIFDETLVELGNRSFNFVVHLENDIILQQMQGDCSGEKETKHSFIQTNKGVLTVRLEICS